MRNEEFCCIWRGEFTLKTVEERIIDGFWLFLTGGVNYYLSEMDEQIGLLEMPREGFKPYGVCPDVVLTQGERVEKGRIVLCDVYDVTMTLKTSEKSAFRYTYAIAAALRDDETLGGVADSVTMIKRVYGEKAVWTFKVWVESIN